MSSIDIKCFKCGELNGLGDVFCKNCGVNLLEVKKSDIDVYDSDEVVSENQIIFRFQRKSSCSIDSQIETNSQEVLFKIVESGINETIAYSAVAIIFILAVTVVIGLFFGDSILSLALLLDVGIILYLIITIISLTMKINIFSNDSALLGTIRKNFSLNVFEMVLSPIWSFKDSHGKIIFSVQTSFMLHGKVLLENEVFKIIPTRKSKKEYYSGIKELLMTSQIKNKRFKVLSPKGNYSRSLLRLEAPLSFKIVTSADIELLPQIGSVIILINKYLTDSKFSDYSSFPFLNN